ncbi:MAG: nucleoside 2-deoxyribosyltransferase [Gammaproteobacteria bacterium]|nr:nucleoside 2-deoxyribosyltransferase [Gammaproteobacteria bacterium]
MWYHAIAHYGTRKRYWWNRDRDDLVQDIIVPFVAKQVKPLTRAGVSSLFNFGSASYITIVKTKTKIKRPAKGKTPSELSNEQFIKKNAATDEFLDELTVLSSSAATRSMIERALTPPKDQIFTIMKFGDDILDSAYEGVIKPLAEEYDLEAVRVDEIQDSGQISQQILENIACSRIVIAELTGERPNCYYEAGFAHALGKELIFIINEDSKIHFDLSGYRFITWKTEAQLRNRLRERLESISEKGAG